MEARSGILSERGSLTEFIVLACQGVLKMASTSSGESLPTTVFAFARTGSFAPAQDDKPLYSKVKSRCLLRHHFNRRHGRIPRHRHKLQQQLTLRVRLQALIFLTRGLFSPTSSTIFSFDRIVFPLQKTLNTRCSEPSAALFCETSAFPCPAWCSMK